jgi:DNA-binding response OmpR family regulator
MQKKIFIADDDPGILEAFRMMLEDEGYIVLAHTHGNIVDEVLMDPPDLLLLDIWMSGQDGREVAKAMREDERTKSIPIIMISAHSDTAKIAKSVGADDFLNKPFDIDEFLTTIEKHLSKE